MENNSKEAAEAFRRSLLQDADKNAREARNRLSNQSNQQRYGK